MILIRFPSSEHPEPVFGSGSGRGCLLSFHIMDCIIPLGKLARGFC
jgi:hypothetical protein